MTHEAIIHRYNRLNGNAISRGKLKEFHTLLQTTLDSNGHGPLAKDVHGIHARVTELLKKEFEGIERIEVIPIDTNKHTGKILRVASGYDKKENKEPGTNNTKDKNAVAVSVPISSIQTDTKRFQNRQDAFSEASANSVAQHYDPNKFDPIVVWKDGNKTFVLSGHSRYEGMKRRGEKNIPVRYFKGSEQEAIQFAKVEANRTATQETLIEDLAAYKLMRDGDTTRGIKKLSKADLQKIFKGKVQKLDAYSNLNAAGLFVQSLSQSNTSNYPYLERNAQWIGILRNQYPVISNQGEDNIFHFFYSDKSGRNLKMNKEDFFKLAKKKLNQLGKDESVLFPECSSDGCKATVDKETDPQKGEAYKRLREINETLESIKDKLTSKNVNIRVSTEDEKKYLRTTAATLQSEKDKIQRDLDLMDKSQASLFGVEYIDELKHINKLKEKRNKISKKFPNKIAKAQSEIDKLEKEFELKHRNGLFIKKFPELYGLEDCAPDGEGLAGLGFTKDGQQKIYDMVTDKVLATMKKDGLFWRKKWEAGKAYNAASYPAKKFYNGINWVMLTMMANVEFGYSSPYFLTFKAIKENGGTLKKKAQSWPVIFYSRIYRHMQTNKNISEKQYEALTKAEQGFVQIIPFIQYYSVFNGQDVEGIDFPKTKLQKELETKTEFERLEYADAIVNNMPNRPDIDHGNRTAHYLQSADKIDMPNKKAFDTAQDYYSVLFHELIHSTGHKDRLKRDLSGDHDSKEYFFEELVAELGASYLCAQVGILYHTLNDSANYLKHYSDQLEEIMKDDNKFFMKAAAAAQKAANYILEGVAELVLAGPQFDAFDIQPKKKTKGPLNALQMAQLQDAIKAGRTPKVNLKANLNAKQKPAPLFDEPINDPKQASLFGSSKKSKGTMHGIVDASTLGNVKFRTFELTDRYKREFHKLNSDTQLMIWGKPGHGKSVWALEFAQYLAKDLGLDTLYVANEEFGRSTFADKINQFKIGHPKLKFTKSLTESMVSNFDVIIFDSINSIGMSLKDYREFVNRNPGKLYVLIVQTTKDGNFRGGQDWEHEVDTAGEISNRKLILHKNRFDKNNPEKMEKLLTNDAINEAKKRAEIRNAVKASQVKEIGSLPKNKIMITKTQIKKDARFKTEKGIVWVIDSIVGDSVKTSMKDGQKGNYKDDIDDVVNFLNEEKSIQVKA